MAKSYWKETWKRRTITGVTALLSLTLALGTLSACSDDEEDDDSAASATDTQLIQNGNFEFYSEMDEYLEDKRDLLNSPTSWSFTSGTPSSNTSSGIINTDQEEWDSYTQSSFSLISDEDTSDSAAIKYAISHWDEASIYDRLEFYDTYEDALDDLDEDSTQAEFFADYEYSIDFEDVENLRAELGDTVQTHYAEDDEEAADNTNVLMIHNSRTSDSVRGTGQYYTSSTTVTLEAGTAAKVSVWVKTAELYHFYSKDDTPVTRDSVVGGAYIGITHTAGGTTLDQMQIKNIRSPYEGEDGYNENNGWVQYTVYLRASTFATSTFKIVLGLGQSSSSNRYEAVDGYALFDDLKCTIMTNADYDAATSALGLDENNLNQVCGIDSKADDKLFDAGSGAYYTYALDLYAGFEPIAFGESDVESSVTTALTKELSGTHEYVSKIASNVDGSSTGSVCGLYSYSALKAMTESGSSAYNSYLAGFFDEDFVSGSFPFLADDGVTADESKEVILLLSTNGASYTATVTHQDFKLEADSYMLVSFFVKTSEILTGRSGATATLVDEGGNETSISAFDSTAVSTVDIDNNTEDGAGYNADDIYNGWVQCFFFIQNDTDRDQTFSLKLSFGTTSVATASRTEYGDGYAAFTNFETKELSATQYGYASTGDYAVSVSLSDVTKDTTYFDEASITSDIENDLALPANFSGILSTSSKVVEGGGDNVLPEGVYAGLANAEYAANYLGTDWAKALGSEAYTEDTASDWWKSVFGDSAVSGSVANQPLAIVNTTDTATDAYGYYSASTTLSSGSYTKISMKIKLSAGATATVYLIDTSDAKIGYNNTLTLSAVNYTYWYDDEGNVCRIDPSDDDFNKKTDILYYLESNGLYSKAGDTSGDYYANLGNYDSDEDGNLITDDETIAYYYYDGAYYAYYDSDAGTYSQVVKPLPTTDDDENSILRYDYSETALSDYGAAITVTGTEANAGQWIEVAFYVYTGNESKSYRLEIWAGTRDNKIGVAANSYVFFDKYTTSTVSDYEDLLAEKLDLFKTWYNASNGYVAGDEGYLTEDDNLPGEYALYYTFTFYDSLGYLRYDETEDEDGVGDPYGSYTQSSYEETLVWFVYDNTAGAYSTDELLSYCYFLDYSAYDVTVEEDDLGTTTTTDNSSDSDVDVWALLASGILAGVLIFTLIAVGVRRVIHWMRKTGRIRPAKPKAKKPPKIKPRKSAAEEPLPEAPAPETEAESPETGNPYED